METFLTPLFFATAVLLAYMLGSVPSSVWTGRMIYNLDVREHGSKNAGATNTFRVLGPKAGSFVLLVDILKGGTAASIPLFLDFGAALPLSIIQSQLLLGLCAVTGHLYPVFADFRGGKGVATLLGVVIAIHWPSAVSALGVFFVFFLATGYVSLGSIAGAVSFPLLLYGIFNWSEWSFLTFAVLVSLLVLLSHRKNIQRLIQGNESRVRFLNRKQE